MLYYTFLKIFAISLYCIFCLSLHIVLFASFHPILSVFIYCALEMDTKTAEAEGPMKCFVYMQVMLPVLALCKQFK